MHSQLVIIRHFLLLCESCVTTFVIMATILTPSSNPLETALVHKIFSLPTQVLMPLLSLGKNKLSTNDKYELLRNASYKICVSENNFNYFVIFINPRSALSILSSGLFAMQFSSVIMSTGSRWALKWYARTDAKSSETSFFYRRAICTHASLSNVVSSFDVFNERHTLKGASAWCVSSDFHNYMFAVAKLSTVIAKRWYIDVNCRDGSYDRNKGQPHWLTTSFNGYITCLQSFSKHVSKLKSLN